MKKSKSASKRPTIKDVARLAGVSLVSVSRVLNDHPNLKESTRKKVQRAIKELKYSPNSVAQSMRTRTSNTFGYIIEDFSSESYAMALQASEETLNEHNKLMIACCSRLDADKEAQFFDVLQARGVDGIFLQGGDETSDETNHKIRASDVPVVLMDRDVPFPNDGVVFDHYKSTRQAIKYLVDLGHRHITIVSGPNTTRMARERLKAFKDEIKARGLSQKKNVAIIASNHLQDVMTKTLALLEQKPRPTAIFAAGNYIMLGVIQAFHRKKISIPKDISLIGADERYGSMLYNPPITVIQPDFEALGKSAAEMLLARVTGEIDGPPRQITAPCEIVLRGSCGPPAKSSSKSGTR